MIKIRSALLACALSAFALHAPATAETATPAPAKVYKPESGQSGKDVVWVPTQQALVDRMLEMAKVTKDDYLIDLGSGDGRTVISAAKLGLRAHGIEYNPDLVEHSQRAAKAEGVGDSATFEKADIFASDFSKATVITLFLLDDLNVKLRPKLLDMKPGTRVVSNTFDMGDWEPDEHIETKGPCTSFCRAMKWVIPAKVDGEWRLGGGDLRLEQKYQKLSGTLTRDGKSEEISDARMNGAEITFTAGGKTYVGRVNGTSMSGGDGGEAWSATRIQS